MSFKEDEMGSNALEFLKDKRELRVHWSLYWANTWPNIVPSLAAFIVETIIVLDIVSMAHGESRKIPRVLYDIGEVVEVVLPDHDITLDDAWPELFMDHKGRYWEVPESISLDMSSLPSDSGEAPSALMPGLCAKVAFSYEKKKDFWRRKETKEDLIFMLSLMLSDQSLEGIACLWEGLAIVSGQMYRRSMYYAFLAGSFAAWFGKDSASAGESQKGGNGPTTNKKESPLNMDLFSSVCYTFQHGQFWKLYDSSLSSPRLNLIFQQQVAGPIVCRIDSKLLLDPKSGKGGPHNEDLIYSLSYSFRLLRSGKVVAWFSPKRKEGMIELRLFEF
ncbi:hypothetical protein Goshw_017620 [Gossypium schwendimanii]|uniref:Uncharacterized protein n=1 Tax=Gossypium schwendimanii TaxID=34291 RepID=A0A7J9NC26_GOSSC|nr:hypothetical protein [Gossypium schwendimanii]